MAYLLFDIGGTKTRIAVSEDLQTYADVKKFKTPVGFQEGVDCLVKYGRDILAGRSCDGVAGGVRGTLSRDRKVVMYDHVLTNWIEQPLVEKLSQKFKAPTFILNDTAIVGLGEAHFGAGQGSDILVYLTISTGVGGVRIEHGQVDARTFGFEPGHQIVDVDRTILGEAVEPTLENLVSGSALAERVGMKAYEVPQEDRVWDEIAKYLAYGLRNTILYWSPDRIVLGGAMIVGDPRILLEDIVRHTSHVLDEHGHMPLIVDAELGDEGGMYGAMVLLQQNL